MKALQINKLITRKNSDTIGQYFTDISKIKPLSVDEEYRISSLAFSGDKNAKDELVRRNLRFVISIAKKYANDDNLADLINEGNIGLVEAADRFDPTKGFKFISFAVWWIRKNIIKYKADNDKTVRMPINKIIELKRVEDGFKTLEQKLDRQPDVNEVLEYLEMDCDNQDVKIIKSLLNSKIDSLDSVISEEDGLTLYDTIADDTIQPTDYFVNGMNSRVEMVKKMKSILTPKEFKVITLIYGFTNGFYLSPKDVGVALGFSKEHIIRVRDKALSKLKIGLKGGL